MGEGHLGLGVPLLQLFQYLEKVPFNFSYLKGKYTFFFLPFLKSTRLCLNTKIDGLVMKYRKYSDVKFENFVYSCINHISKSGKG